MRVYNATILLVLLLCSFENSTAQNAPVAETNGKSVKLVQYMIRKGDYVIAIARRFHVSPKEIIKLNRFKGREKAIYPGRKLWIPVAVKEKVWSPENSTNFNPFLTKEDARPREDFEVDMDLLDEEVKNDFVATTEMEADSIQRDKIANHILKIEKRIQYLQYRLDSIKNADLSFQFDENDKNSILHKMKLARDRYYSSGPIGLEIDSLNVLKAHLGEENGRIKARLTEYEYLQQNTEYFRRNKEGMKSSSIETNPSSQIANESNYIKSGSSFNKVKVEDRKTAVESEKNIVSNSKSKEEEKPKIEEAVNQEKASTKALTESEKEQKNSTENRTKERGYEVIGAMPNSTATNELKTNEDKKLGVNRNFIRSQGNKPYVAPPSSNTVKTEVKNPEKVASQKPILEENSPINEGKSVANNNVTTKPFSEVSKPKNEVKAEVKKVVNSDTNIQTKESKDNSTKSKNITPKETAEIDVDPQVYHRLDTISSFKGKSSSNSLSFDTSRFDMSSRIDSAVLKPKPEKVSDDPLASYKTDSNFIMKTVVIKDITITDYRNRPKYLTPVDSVHRIKAEFYLILARKALAKPDFKEGEKLLRKSLELNPNNASAWMLHADLYAATGYPEKALKEYTISTEIDSTNPKAFYNMALLFGRANNTDKAYQCYSKALDISDKYLLAYLGRAALLIEQRDYTGAIDDYDKVVAINRYYSLAFKGRGLAKMEAHDFAGAVLDFNQYLEIEDPDGYILYQRGISKVLSNQLLQGCLDFSSSFELGFKQAQNAIKKFCQ